MKREKMKSSKILRMVATESTTEIDFSYLFKLHARRKKKVR